MNLDLKKSNQSDKNLNIRLCIKLAHSGFCSLNALLKMTNLERGGEATHGDVGGCTACQVEVGAAHFSWEMMIMMMMMMILMTIITIIVIIIKITVKYLPIVLRVPDVPGAVCRFTISM